MDEQPWINPFYGSWGGFHTRATLDITFKQYKGDEPWDLSHYTGSFNPFTLTQTVSAGTAGICKATYMFRIHDVVGDIGSFSLPKHGRSSAILDLGLYAVAKNVGNSNCGANFEETAHPFGETQTFDIPIQVTGAYFAGELSLASTTKFSLAGGKAVTKIDGTLVGG